MAGYLVTGAAGFIGSNLVHHLVANGHEIVGVDNLVNGNLENLESVMDKIHFIEGDLTDYGVCMDAVDHPKVDVDFIFHLAALGSVPRSIADPATTLENNIMSTVNMLEVAKEFKIKRFVNSSSASVYGEDLNHVHDGKTEYMATKPINPYALSKLTCEMLCKQYHDLFELETISLRYFNVFGPRQRADSDYAAVVPKFINAMLHNDSPIIFGNGKQTRDFTYVDNVINANILAAETKNKDAFGNAFNVCCGGVTTINVLFAYISQLLKFDKQPIYNKQRKGDIQTNFGNCSLASAALLYTPEIFVLEGMKKTVQWYKGKMNAKVERDINKS